MLSPVLSPIIALPLSFSSSAAPHLTGTYKGLSTTILLRSILCETKIAIFLLLFSPLFIDNKIPSFWYYKAFCCADEKYPYREAVWGYYELVFDDMHYEQLVDVEKVAYQIYFKRKMELEQEFSLDK